MNLRNVGDSEFTVHHTILVEMCLHLKPTRFSGWVVHRVVIESLGLYQTFDSMEDACDLFEALVHNGHNADLFVGYVMNDGKVFVCDRSRGFNPVYSSNFSMIPPRTKSDIGMMRERFLANGWTHTV